MPTPPPPSISWIEFSSDRTAEELARLLAPLIQPECPVGNDVPYHSQDGNWWELSNSNDHKLDDLGMCGGVHVFRYRERYLVQERLQRVWAYLNTLGIQNLRSV